MSSFEKRAWLALCSMGPAYAVYFVIQAGFPALLPTMGTRIACLAVVAGLHAIAYLAGWLVIKRQERHEGFIDDERDRVIDGRATRVAYFALLAAMMLVVVMPFDHEGWQIVNAALFFIVVAEMMRNALIVAGYRKPRLAH